MHIFQTHRLHRSLEAQSGPLSILPPELWRKIFAFACVDGGATGCALALVSRSMRALAASTRFHSVLVVGFRGMKCFAHTLQHTPEQNRRVRFLFISDQPPELVGEALGRDIQLSERLVRRQRNPPSFWRRITAPPPHANKLVEIRAAYDTILTLSAPYLELLTAHLSRWWIEHPIPLHVHLPRLYDLTLYYGGLNWEAPLPCPNLRRLHVVGFPHTAVVLGFPGMPRLEYIRLSGWEALGMAYYLLGIDPKWPPALVDQNFCLNLRLYQVPCPQNLQCLQTIFIDPAVMARVVGQNTMGVKLQGFAGDGVVNFIVARFHEYREDSGLQARIIQDWRDVVAGHGLGAWGVSSSSFT
jgi:hypothetical protein